MPVQRWAVPVAGAVVLLVALMVAGLTSASPNAETAASGGCKGLAKSVKKDFAKLDADKSKTVDLIEAKRDIGADFKDMDLNRNGVVSVQDVQLELDRTGGGQANRPLEKYLPFDSNGNGKITKKEYVAKVRKRMFRPMDANEDAIVTVKEAIAFTAKRAPGCGS